MKYLSILMITLMGMALPAQAQSDAISTYFDQYMEDERFTVVYISSKMFGLISRIELDEIEEDESAKAFMEVAKDIKGLRVLTTEENTEAFYKEAMGKINTNEYEILMTVRDEGENVRFYIKDNGDIINELLLLVGGQDEFVMVSFVGNIDLKQISKLANNIDVKGTEHLDKLDEKESKSYDDDDDDEK